MPLMEKLPDKDGISESESGAFDARKCDGERLAQRAFFE